MGRISIFLLLFMCLILVAESGIGVLNFVSLEYVGSGGGSDDVSDSGFFNRVGSISIPVSLLTDSVIWVGVLVFGIVSTGSISKVASSLVDGYVICLSVGTGEVWFVVVVVSLIIVLLSFDSGLLGQCLAICPSCLQTKQFSLSVVVKMRYTVSSKVMVNESGIFLASSGLTYICLLKLRMWEYSASLILAFNGVML